MSNLLKHAKYELSLLSEDKPDEMQEAMNEHILKMVEIFSEEGHSGFSASYATNILQKLLRFEPLKPLTGADDEWVEVQEGRRWQNKRCGHVFKDADGKAYDSEGIIFKEPDGNCYQNRDSRVFIEFPYTPKREYVDREAA